jgi:hypothetical protein
LEEIEKSHETNNKFNFEFVEDYFDKNLSIEEPKITERKSFMIKKEKIIEPTISKSGNTTPIHSPRNGSPSHLDRGLFKSFKLPKKTVDPNKVYGVSINKLIPVPEVIENMLLYVENECLHIVGLFRLTGTLHQFI